jgi:hypothetical protein
MQLLHHSASAMDEDSFWLNLHLLVDAEKILGSASAIRFKSNQNESSFTGGCIL